MYLLEVHSLRSVQEGFSSIVLSQPRYCYRTPLALGREGTVLDEGAPLHQALDAFHVCPELAVGLRSFEVVKDQPCSSLLLVILFYL